MVLFVVRHGQTLWNKKRVIQGQMDSLLSELGRKQMLVVARRAKYLGIDNVVSSDLFRAIEAAQIIADILETVVSESLSYFRERNLGILQGKMSREAKIEYQTLFDEKERVLSIPPALSGIEAENCFGQRITNGLNYLRSKYGKQRILLVAHGMVIRFLYADLVQNTTLSRMENVRVDNATIHRFEY